MFYLTMHSTHFICNVIRHRKNSEEPARQRQKKPAAATSQAIFFRLAARDLLHVPSHKPDVERWLEIAQLARYGDYSHNHCNSYPVLQFMHWLTQESSFII